MKLQKNGSTYQTSISVALVKAKGWKKGDKLGILINKQGNLEIHKENDI